MLENCALLLNRPSFEQFHLLPFLAKLFPKLVELCSDKIILGGVSLAIRVLLIPFERVIGIEWIVLLLIASQGGISIIHMKTVIIITR
jgi:hypothetical protein